MSRDSIGILATARLGSTRLRRKHLLKVEGRTLLDWLLRRIKAVFAAELAAGAARIIIATTPEPENLELRQFEDQGIVVFAGSKDNIPLRHLEAARALGLSGIVSVDGDDVLCASEAMRAVYDGLAGGAVGVRTEGLPVGMNAWGYAAAFLAESLEGHHEARLETGWGRVFDFNRFATIPLAAAGASDAVRLTLDYQEDFDLFRAVIEGLGDTVVKASAEDIVRYILKNDLTRLNDNRVEEYWANFERVREAERAHSSKKAML